jgi:hypothetical protein
MAMKQLLLVM